MPFIQNDHVVEKIVPARANPALGYAILPAETGSLRLDAKALYDIDDFSIEIASAIKDQILGCGVVGKCLTELLNDPCAGWMPGHIAVTMTKKQYNTPNVSAGTVKKSIAAIALRWLLRNAVHRFAGLRLQESGAHVGKICLDF